MLVSSIAHSIGVMNNAAYSMMSSSNDLLSLSSFSGTNSNTNLLNQSEKTLLLNKSQSELSYKLSDAQLKSLKKLEKENIKRTFSTFA